MSSIEGRLRGHDHGSVLESIRLCKWAHGHQLAEHIVGNSKTLAVFWQLVANVSGLYKYLGTFSLNLNPLVYADVDSANVSLPSLHLSLKELDEAIRKHALQAVVVRLELLDDAVHRTQ